MVFDRIGTTIDVGRMGNCHAGLVGGTNGLAADLVRSGLGRITLMDPQRFEISNLQRQDVLAADAERRNFKTHACAGLVRSINPDVHVETHETDLCALADADIDRIFGPCDVLIFGTDSFAAQARANQIALRLGKPAVWIGLYTGGRAGEIVFHIPGVTPACYRCICSARYRAHSSGVSDKTSSQGGTILDLRLVDAIAGQIAVGALTRGADNRFGKLIDQLGNRNLLQVKIDPGYTLNGKDIFARHLGDGPANFSFTTIALPMERDPNCPDCGHGE